MPLSRIVDAALEGTVALSFGRLGSTTRRRLEHWQQPVCAPDHVALVTGATSGIGESVATQLAAANWTVWLLGRSEQKLQETIARITAVQPDAKVKPLRADLNRLTDVVAVAEQLRRATNRLDALVHNAGAMSVEYHRTEDDIEQTAQIHLVAPFLLTHELLSLLQATPGSRVITVSSGGMYTQGLDVADLEPTPTRYNGTTSYARTKRAQVVLNEVWATRTEARGITFHAMHPGWVATPGLTDSLPNFDKVRRRRAPTRSCGSPLPPKHWPAMVSSGTTGTPAQPCACQELPCRSRRQWRYGTGPSGTPWPFRGCRADEFGQPQSIQRPTSGRGNRQRRSRSDCGLRVAAKLRRHAL
jgi:dehydrogenase/reductase SDR family protein 12